MRTSSILSISRPTRDDAHTASWHDAEAEQFEEKKASMAPRGELARAVFARVRRLRRG